MIAVAIAPDGTWLATASGDGTVRTWAADGTPRATLTGHLDSVRAVAIAPDGTWLATGGGDGTVRTWAADGTPRTALTGHERPVNAVAIAPDGTWLATGGSDRTVRTWAADGTPRTTLTGHERPVNAVAIAPDGTWLATGGGTTGRCGSGPPTGRPAQALQRYGSTVMSRAAPGFPEAPTCVSVATAVSTDSRSARRPHDHGLMQGNSWQRPLSPQ